ncbi:hypothetical protein TPA0906_27740 [Streptomyces olivaceus]|nr:hypothetical protein TPA0906_27740 [Streptomyces olivaceus]
MTTLSVLGVVSEAGQGDGNPPDVEGRAVLDDHSGRTATHLLRLMGPPLTAVWSALVPIPATSRVQPQ